MALTSREREAEMEEAEEAPVVQEPIKVAGDAESEDEDDGTVYNPLNLPYVAYLSVTILSILPFWPPSMLAPHLESERWHVKHAIPVCGHWGKRSGLTCRLGWDGKPIPYWLYKLHGLGVTFSCEICAGATYQGRKGELLPSHHPVR